MIYRTGDIGFAIGHSELSNTILKATKSKFSHTFQFIYLNHVLCVFDAQIEGCYPMEFENWKAKFGYDFVVLTRPENVAIGDFSNNCINYFGLKYDVKGLATGLFKSFTLKFWKKKDMNDKFRNNGKFWCFELTARLLHFPNPEDWTGEQIYDELISKKWLKL